MVPLANGALYLSTHKYNGKSDTNKATQETNDRAIRTPMKIGVNLYCNLNIAEIDVIHHYSLTTMLLSEI
jgi:hypothetical protein